uniref:Uncharacterized protein n=1 Tax=Octopus bimaculoides TaxID=37653 RepID=A0A0L8H6Y3_OCTBM
MDIYFGSSVRLTNITYFSKAAIWHKRYRGGRCSHIPDNTEFPLPGKCRKYFRCYNGKAEEKCCRWGYSFKQGRGCRRDYHCKEKCDSQHPVPDPHDLQDRCRNMPQGSELRVPGKCRQYLRCYNGKAEEKCCQWGYSFKPGRGCRRDYHCKEKCDSQHPVPDPHGLQDRCRYLPDHSTFPMEGRCRGYWTCYNRKPRASCCLEGYSFIEGKGCQRNYRCRESCIPSPAGDCRPEASYDFKNSLDDQSGNNVRAKYQHVKHSRSGKIKFSRSSRMTIEHFARQSFGTHLFIALKFKKYKYGSRRQVLLTNCACCVSQKPSIQIIVTRRRIKMKLATSDGRREKLKFRLRRRKVRLTLQYDGNTFRGTVNNQKRSAQLRGRIANTHSPLVIGGCHDDSFVGKLFYIHIYKCLPSDRRQLK